LLYGLPPKTLGEDLDGIASKMPHISDLPPEILGEKLPFPRVTSLENQLRIPAPYSPNYRSVASPYSISHVSRRWRDIALTTAALWSRLCVVSSVFSRNG